MYDLDKNNAAALCSAFHSAIVGALTGPLATMQGSPDAAVAALLATTADFSRAVGVDFATMACSMVATVEPNQEKALGTLVSCYVSKGK